MSGCSVVGLSLGKIPQEIIAGTHACPDALEMAALERATDRLNKHNSNEGMDECFLMENLHAFSLFF